MNVPAGTTDKKNHREVGESGRNEQSWLVRVSVVKRDARFVATHVESRAVCFVLFCVVEKGCRRSMVEWTTQVRSPGILNEQARHEFLNEN